MCLQLRHQGEATRASACTTLIAPCYPCRCERSDFAPGRGPQEAIEEEHVAREHRTA